MKNNKHAARRKRTNRLNYQVLEPRQVLTTWIPQGPFSATDGQVENISPNDQIAGAIHTVLSHPTNANIMYLGGTNSGVWRTNNAQSPNPNWTPLTDDLPSSSIGALAFDVSQPSRETIYAGTGRFSSYFRTGNERVGLYKSTDSGNSWVVLNDKLVGANISGIAANGDNVVVSVNVSDNFSTGSVSNANIGIFRSTDGGLTFTQMSVGNGSGPTGLPEGASYDLVADPRDPAVLYTSMVFADIGATGSNGVYKSTDGGATWSRTSDSAMDALIISAGTSNLEIAVGRNDNVYAAIINFGNLVGLFRSGDAGATWTQMDTPSTNENGTDVGLNPNGGKGPQATDNPSPAELAGGQGNIHFSILADPANDNIVYVGGDRQPRSNGDAGGFPNSIGANDFTGRLFRGDATLASGSQFVHLTHSDSLGAAGGGTANSSAPHADSREMTFDLLGNLIEVDDGGIYRRTSPQDNTGDWFAITGNLQVTEAHDIAYDNLSNVFITGNQDTGTTYQATEGAQTWTSLSTADGGDVVVDTVSRADQGQSIRYSSNQNLGGFRQTIWDSTGHIVNVTFPLLRGFSGDGAFVTPVELNAIDPLRLAIQGRTTMFESLNQGDDLSNLGTFGQGNDSVQNAIAYGGRRNGTDNADLLWVGSSNEVLVRSVAGATLTATSDPGFGTIRDLTIDPDDWGTAFVVDSDQVFSTTDVGANWADITGNLMTFATQLYSTAYVPTDHGDAIVAGTNQGVYATQINDLGNWYKVGIELPNTLVFDVEYDITDDVLVAGTLGRGAWGLPLANIVVVPGVLQDFGDAPDSSQTGFAGTYPVTLNEAGASHTDGGPSLGFLSDTEENGTHSLNADFDDTDGIQDDEDGVNFGGPILGSTFDTTPSTITVNLQNADPFSNRLDAWIDWNRDGDWSDPGEQIFSNFDLGTTNGEQSLSYTIPQVTPDEVGFSYARFRVSTTGGLDVTGLTIGGEVEDHRIEIRNLVAPTEGDDVIVVTIDDLVNVEVNGESFTIDSNVVTSFNLDALGGNDKITIFDSAGTDITTVRDFEVSLAGGFSFVGQNVETVRLVSRGGSDVANLFGSDRDEVFESFTGGGKLTGDRFTYETQNYFRTNAFALQGNDLAFLRDSPGDDRFYGSNVFANLQTSVGTYNVRDFDRVAVHATEGGFDFATLVGTNNEDTLYSSPTFTSLTNGDQPGIPGRTINAVGFERTWSDGAGGNDTASLIGSNGDDRLNSRLANSYLFSDGFFNQAIRFENVTVENAGGNDEAILFDTPGDDTFFGTPEYAVLFSELHRSQANGFDKVSAYGSAGFDRATLVDSDSNDRYVARAKSAFLVGSDFLNYVESFNSVSATSSGGADVAILHSSVEDDRFFGSAAEAYVDGSTFFNQAFNFRNVTANFELGGFDIGTFQDSTGSDTFIANGNKAVLFNDDYIIHTTGLDFAIARSNNGGVDVLSVSEIDYEIRIIGDWV